METTYYTGDLQTLLRWALNRRDDKPPEPYGAWVRNHMPKNCLANVGYHVGGLTERSPLDGDWHIGYPHAHNVSVGWPNEATTVLTYLAVAQEGGEFAIGGLDRNDPYELITPEPGLTLIMDATVWHGVKPVRKGTRIALITSGVPVDE